VYASDIRYFCGSFVHVLMQYVMLIEVMVILVVIPCGQIDGFQTVWHGTYVKDMLCCWYLPIRL